MNYLTGIILVIKMKTNIKQVKIILILLFSFFCEVDQSIAKKIGKEDKGCISIGENECARHKDGSPQKCQINGDSGICIEINNKCQCVSQPQNCSEYEELLSISCYECDGSRVGCPIGKVVTIEYGSSIGEIYCCCNEGNVREVSKENEINKEGVLSGSEGGNIASP